MMVVWCASYVVVIFFFYYCFPRTSFQSHSTTSQLKINDLLFFFQLLLLYFSVEKIRLVVCNPAYNNNRNFLRPLLFFRHCYTLIYEEKKINNI